ncbi:HTH-type transcriptional repressor NsrR [bioreactor metagenome]|uniref:HTH-type transcriptional repressor NsrR n=1 Tax=bioreactor metagenome TaxID=1076179 RepID=A0A645AS78_9ZZZZ|nr:Rrf2 family transcriptional regulator [Candidatus Metalachnospira sp.]
MLISRQSDYAVRVVRALSDMQIHSAVEIESRENVTVAFSYKILKKLEKAGIVNAIRGANGGYKLSKGCNEFTLFDIISAVDDDFIINECMHDGYICNSRCDSECLVHKELCRIQSVLINELKSKTMAEVLEWR